MKKLILALSIVAFLAAPALAKSTDDNQSSAGIGTSLTVFELPEHKLQPAIVLDIDRDIKNNATDFMARVELNVFNWIKQDTD